MRFPVYGHFEYVKKKSEPKFDIDDYLFIIHLRANKDLDLDVLFELAYGFARKHQQKLMLIPTKSSYLELPLQKTFLQNSYFSAIKKIPEPENVNNFFFDLPSQEAGESVFDEDNEDDESDKDDDDEFDFPVLPVSDMDGELYFLEPFSILKPIRILQYSLERPDEDRFNYRNWRPTNFTTETNQVTGYFYGYDPAVTFNYEMNSAFGYDATIQTQLVRTVRYDQRFSITQSYLPEAKSEDDEIIFRRLRDGAKNTAILENNADEGEEQEQDDDEEEFDALANILYISLESYPSQYITGLVVQHLKKFSSDLIFPDWFSILLFFNVVFFLSDYVSVFIYWYFPFLLNIFTEDLAAFSKIYYIYAVYFLFFIFLLFYFYVIEILLFNNLIYKLFNFAFILFVGVISLFFFIFPFSIIFYIIFLFFFVPLIIVFTFFQLFVNKFHMRPKSFFLSCSNPETIFGYYTSNFYFPTTPRRFSATIFFSFNIFSCFARVDTRKFRNFYFRPFKVPSFSVFNKLRNQPSTPLNFNVPIYYPNLFSDISFQSALESRIPPKPHGPLLPEDDLEYNIDTPFAPDLTGNRAFYHHKTIDYRLAPENSTQGNQSYTNYQSLFAIENDWGQFVEDSTTHSQGYWYPSSSVFSSPSISIYHPYTIFHSSISPFFRYYQLKIFLNSLQLEQLSTLPRHQTIFSMFVIKKFYDTGLFFPVENQMTDVELKIFTSFRPYFFFYKIALFFNFFFNLVFIFLKFFFSFFPLSSNSSSIPIKLFQLFFFPTTQNYRTFLRFYFKILKDFKTQNFSTFGQIFRFFFFAYIFTMFIPTQKYYVRIKKVSSSILTLFFHF